MKYNLRPNANRYTFFAFLFLLVGIVVIVRAAYIIFAEKEYWAAVKDKFVRENIVVPPVRGNILSSDGQYMASLLPIYRLYIDYNIVEKDEKQRIKYQKRKDSTFLADVDSLALGLSELFPDCSKREFKRVLMDGFNKKSRHHRIYPHRISYDKYKRVLELPYIKLGPNRSGFHVERIDQRARPFGSLAQRTIGDIYIGKDAAKSGLEKGLDSLLRGVPGKSHKQKVQNRYVEFVDIPARDGYDVQTTIDVDMQDVCEKALGDQLRSLSAEWGVCLLMEVETGDIKAIVNLGRDVTGKYSERQNWAVSNLLEPGSVFKSVSFLVGFSDNKFDLQTNVATGGGQMIMHGRKMKDHNWHKGGYGTLSVPDILGQSSNIGVSYLIDRAYQNDPKRFVEGIRRTGIADDYRLPIPGYTTAKIPDPEKNKNYWSKTTLPWMSIGYATQIPPIATLAFYNGVANNGKMMRPRLVKAVLERGEVVQEFPPIVQRERMASADAVKKLQHCLRWVVGNGLGKKAGSPYFNVSGKTGTAQIWTKSGFGSKYLISFAGYFPSEKPRYSMIVCMEKGGMASGGGHCGPVFRQVAEAVMAKHLRPDLSTARDTLNIHTPFVMKGDMQAARRVLQQLRLPYQLEADEQKVRTWGEATTTTNNVQLTATLLPKRNVMPDVTGAGARDAIYLLEQAGLKVRLQGVGRVTKQSIPAGKTVTRGEAVTLTLMRKHAPVVKEVVPDIIEEEGAGVVAPDTNVIKRNAEQPAKPKKAETAEKTKRKADERPAPKDVTKQKKETESRKKENTSVKKEKTTPKKDATEPKKESAKTKDKNKTNSPKTEKTKGTVSTAKQQTKKKTNP